MGTVRPQGAPPLLRRDGVVGVYVADGEPL